jgi:hypothetical protein
VGEVTAHGLRDEIQASSIIGYVISGERTLSDFFERVSPFGTAFMALDAMRQPSLSLQLEPFPQLSWIFPLVSVSQAF